MKKTKIPDDFFKTSELAQIMLPISEKMKALTNLKIAFVKCATPSQETGKPVIDPFLLTQTLKNTQLAAMPAIPAAGQIYESLKQWAAAECSRAGASFEPKLRTFCEIQSLKLDGRYPSFLIDGFLTVRAREADHETEVGSRTIPSMSVDTIALAVKEVVTEERTRKFDRVRFVEELFTAYERCLLLQKATAGDPLAIRKVYQELVFVRQADGFIKSAKKTLFSEYTLDFFARDLTKVLAGSLCQTRNGNILVVSPTSFAQDGIAIWQNGQARIIGRIAFTSESQ